MGGAVSAGEDNDELIDNLVEAEYIKSPQVERIFRAVDRGDYYLEGCKENAYRDLAWKHGNIHLSAPCIYSEVMESLKLRPGMSFLNLGSGTGYLSTMAGLMLGTYGVNHGVELHDEVVKYARAKLEEFQSSSPALDKYEFCPPNFVVGNCLLLDSTCHQYDRVYCGASCPTEHENYMKNLVRVGGILVMPLNDHLLQVTRTGETTFEVKNVLPVSFASLVQPNPSELHNLIKLPEKNPLKLKEICRSVIRVLLRANAEAENPSLRDKKKLVPSRRKKNRRRIRKVVIPVFDDRSESGDNRNTSSNEHADDEMDPRSKYLENGRKENVSEELICSEHTVRLSECGCEVDKAINDSKDDDDDDDDNTERANPGNGRRASSLDDTNEKPCSSHYLDDRRSSAEDIYKNVSDEELFNVAIKAVIVQNESPKDPVDIQNHNTNNQVEAMDTSDVVSEVPAVDPVATDIIKNGHCDQKPDAEVTGKDLSETNNLTDATASTSYAIATDFSDVNEVATDVPCANQTLKSDSKISESDKKNNFGVHHIVNGIANGDSGIDNISDDSVPSSSSDPEKTEEGENGLADISASRTDCSDDNDADRRLTRLSTYLKRSAEENDDEEPYVPRIGGESRITAKCCRKAVVFKRIAYSDVDSDDFDDFESDSGKESYPKECEGTREKSDLSCYTYHMKQKINMLPLPQYLKMYLNFSRPI